MFIKLETKVKLDKLGRSRKIRTWFLECDFCHTSMTRAGQSVNESSAHYCNRRCRNLDSVTGGSLRNKINVTTAKNDPGRKISRKKYEKTCLLRYGHKVPTKNVDVRKKIANSVKKIAQTKDYRQKVLQGLQQKYGNVTSSFQAQEVREKIKKTCIERYGVEHHMQCVDIKQKLDYSSIAAKRMLTCMKKYGGPSPMSSPEVRMRFRETCLERYGVDHPHKTTAVVNSVRNTCQSRYGVDCVFQLQHVIDSAQDPLVKQKAFETLKSQGLNYVSKIETKFFLALQELTTTYSQIWVHQWPIDMYVSAIDTYVQFDGVYWHGLDRKLEEIMSSKAPRDKAIMKKWKTDGVQNAWFSSNNMKLVRITDLEFKRKDFDMSMFLKVITKESENHGYSKRYQMGQLFDI